MSEDEEIVSSALWGLKPQRLWKLQFGSYDVNMSLHLFNVTLLCRLSFLSSYSC